ncbi:uncharacterized protein PG998_008739 [Apiospora kogelbergensis]|uniref:uncharacterized protein n=1 Tax=Apiospora kogelbergensis TaxID=1337665 RepID=UPI003130B7D6
MNWGPVLEPDHSLTSLSTGILCAAAAAALQKRSCADPKKRPVLRASPEDLETGLYAFVEGEAPEAMRKPMEIQAPRDRRLFRPDVIPLFAALVNRQVEVIHPATSPIHDPLDETCRSEAKMAADARDAVELPTEMTVLGHRTRTGLLYLPVRSSGLRTRLSVLWNAHGALCSSFAATTAVSGEGGPRGGTEDECPDDAGLHQTRNREARFVRCVGGRWSMVDRWRTRSRQGELEVDPGMLRHLLLHEIQTT